MPGRPTYSLGARRKRLHPFPAVWIGDLPEVQHLTCLKANACPACMIDPHHLSDYNEACEQRTTATMKAAFHQSEEKRASGQLGVSKQLRGAVHLVDCVPSQPAFNMPGLDYFGMFLPFEKVYISSSKFYNFIKMTLLLYVRRNMLVSPYKEFCCFIQFNQNDFVSSICNVTMLY